MRLAWDNPEAYNIVTMNDIAAPESIAYLIQYDSIHGTWRCKVECGDDGMITITDGDRSQKIKFTQEKDITKVCVTIALYDTLCERVKVLYVLVCMHCSVLAIQLPGKVSVSRIAEYNRFGLQTCMNMCQFFDFLMACGHQIALSRYRSNIDVWNAVNVEPVPT